MTQDTRYNVYISNLIGICLIFLKLLKVIELPWWAVTLPIYGAYVVAVAVLVSVWIVKRWR